MGIQYQNQNHKMAGTKAQYAVCTAATDCKAASSCCTAFGTSATATTLSTVKVCFDAGTAVGGYTIPTSTGGVTSAMLTSGKGCLQTACPKAAAGASTLAVSAAAVATAVYMM